MKPENEAKLMIGSMILFIVFIFAIILYKMTI